MTLFEHQATRQIKTNAPLASRIRPANFDELAGQDHIIGPNRVLRKSIEVDQIPSMILWGPPGSGKTTLANLIANTTKCHFESISAVGSGVSDLRGAVTAAQERIGMHGQRTILFIDEIHRFNKSQQDVILPYVENGTIILIGATTENPSFEVNSPLLSRSRVFTLKPLTKEQIKLLINRAIADVDRGIAKLSPSIDDDAIESLAILSNGDARTALNTLELAAGASKPDTSGTRHITLADIEDAIQQRFVIYDKDGDQHYETISAFIKSIRGSDPDASIYWLARMIEAGEDPLFIARRLVILASEDVGLADPDALSVAVAAQQAVHFIGMPEGKIPLAEATIYLATAPKSNAAYAAIGEAIKDVLKTRNDPVPLHLRNATTGLMKNMGYGKGYKYAHDYDDHFEPMDNLPEKLNGKRYYSPTNIGYEKLVAERLRKWWGPQNKQTKSE